MAIEKAPLVNITEKHSKCSGTGIIESDIDRHCYCDEGMITRFADREEQQDADHTHYVKVVEQVVKEITHELQSEVHVHQRLGKQRVDNFCKWILRRYGVEE